MNGKMKEFFIVKEYEYIKQLIEKLVSIIDKGIRDCLNKFFHTFDHIYVCDNKLTNIGNNTIFTLLISDKNMSLYELKSKIENCSRRWFCTCSNK